MKVLSAMEVAEWFKSFEKVGPRQEYVHADETGLFYTNPEASCITLEYPPKLEQLPFFARYVARIGYEEQYFDGAMLWIQSWGVWGLFNEGIGCRIVEKMNAAAGQPAAFEAAPGHQFRADELADAVGMLMQPMIFAWDSFYLPRWSYGGCSSFFLHISHHSVVDVVMRTKEFQEKVLGELNGSKLAFQPASQARVERFCRPKGN